MTILLLILVIIIIVSFVINFYRCPTPIIRKNNEDVVYAPSFGKILKIIKNDDDDSIFVSIFLNPFDIHYQYYPVSGIVKDIKYDATGKFSLAYELNKSNENEKSITTLVNKNGEFKIYQIAGYLVRRIENYGNTNKIVESGEILGIIHFGSRVDIIIPRSSEFVLQVKENDVVKGFNTMLGYYK
jgi:phosphatidylserine decarboxylase